MDVHVHQWEGAILRGEGAACRELCKKTAELIEMLVVMLFGLWTRVGPRNHVFGGVYIGATWRVPLHRSCAAAMQPCVKLL